MMVNNGYMKIISIEHINDLALICTMKMSHITGQAMSSDNVAEFLQELKQRKYFSVFREKNLAMTKKQLQEAVSEDNYIKQSINSLSELHRVINILMKRLREWFELYYPELSREIRDHEKFLELLWSKKKQSMGAALSQFDLKPIKELSSSIQRLYSLKSSLEQYLEHVMQKQCPNVTTVAGYLLGAKLLERAGSLQKLASLPASTIQLLGAEKALFRHLRSGAKSPKHGIIHEHPFISEAAAADKGKIARTLADKIAIAARVDFFKGKFIGTLLRKQVQEKLR